MVKGPMYQVPLMAKLYSSLRKVSHLQLSLVIQVTRGGRKLPFRPLNCGERNPSQLYHCPPLVDLYLSTYCINTQREPKFFGGNAKERNRKDTVDCLLDDYFPPNLTSSLLHWPKTNRRPGISQQRWVFSESAENCNLGSATRVSHTWVPTAQGEDSAFTEKKRKVRGCREQRARKWVLTKKEESFFSLGSAVIWGPFLVSQLSLTEVSAY